MMNWLRIRPSPSPTSSLNSRAASLSRSRLQRGSSSIADSLTSFDFRRKTYSEGEVDTIDLVSLEPISPCRISRSHSLSELPQSEEVIVDHVTLPPSPPISVHEALPSPSLPSPSKIKNAVAFFERKASGCLAIQLSIEADTSTTNNSPINPSPTYTNAARAENELRNSIARADSPSSGSEDSMASLVSMLNEQNVNTCTAPGGQQCSTPVHHGPGCSSTIKMLSPTWMHPPRSARSSEQKSESTSSLRTLGTNRNIKQDEPNDLQPVGKTSLHSRFARSGQSRSRTVSEKELSEDQSAGKHSVFRRPFNLSRRSQSRTSTEADYNSVAALPCFMTSSDDFANHRAVQGLHMIPTEQNMSAFIDGSNSVNQSFSVAGEPQNSSSASIPQAVASSPVIVQSPRPIAAQLPRPLSLRSGLPLSSRSLSKAPATSAINQFKRPPGMHISDMPLRSLIQIDEMAALPSPKLPSPGLPSSSYVDAMSFAWDVPRCGSPASIASSSRRHSLQQHRVPVKIDSAAHFPRSVSPSWEVRPQSFSAIIVDAPLNPIPLEPTFSSRHTSDASNGDTPRYPMPMEVSFERKRSNSKFEPDADLQPISEVPLKTEVLQNGLLPPLPMDGHKSAGATYDPPVCSPHDETLPPEPEREPPNQKKKVKKLKNEKKPHERTHKIVRYSRRFILRRKVLNLLLGRQLGGAVANGLKAITCLPVGTDSLDLAVVAVPGGVKSPLHAGAVFPLAVVVGRDELESEERMGKLHVVESRSCVALTAPDVTDADDGSCRRSRHLSMDDLSYAIRHVDYRSGTKGHVRIE